MTTSLYIFLDNFSSLKGWRPRTLAVYYVFSLFKRNIKKYAETLFS